MYEKHDWIISLFPYRSRLMKDLILFLKKHNHYILPESFYARLDMLFSAIFTKHILDKRKIILIPIPARNERMQNQGFNQATTLAHLFSQILSILVIENLLINNPESQREKQAFLQSRNERIARLAHAFTINPDILANIAKDTHIILIDDVTTTGATFAEARRTLEEIGFMKIIAVSLAG